MSYLTAPTRYVQVAGKAVAYRDLGEVLDVPVLVMLIHLAATMDNWDPALIDLIAAQWRVIVAHLVLVGTGLRGGVGVDRVTSKTFCYMARAALRRMDPKRYIFSTCDERGEVEARKALGRLAFREAKHAGDPMNIRGFLRQFIAIHRWGKDAQDGLAWVTPATLIVNGDQDMMVPTSNSYDMHNRIVGSELIIYPDAGHGSIFQYAPRFADDLEEFLAS